MPLQELSVADGERVRDTSAISACAGDDRRSSDGMDVSYCWSEAGHVSLVRQRGSHVSLLPRVRVDRLLRHCRCTRHDWRQGRRLRRPDVSTAHDFGLRRVSISLGYECRGTSDARWTSRLAAGGLEGTRSNRHRRAEYRRCCFPPNPADLNQSDVESCSIRGYRRRVPGRYRRQQAWRGPPRVRFRVAGRSSSDVGLEVSRTQDYWRGAPCPTPPGWNGSGSTQRS